MEVNHTTVAQVSPVMQHSSAGYGDYNSVHSDTNIYATGSSGDQVPSETPGAAVYATDGSHYSDVNAYSRESYFATSLAPGDSTCLPASGEGVAPSVEQVPGQDCTTVMPTNMTDYDTVNGGSNQFPYSDPTAADENKGSANESMETAVHQLFDDGSVMSGEEGRLWGLVKANCLDFNAWTALIQETEKENDIIKIRKVYDSFLAEFPLCYGYWKKYADHVGRLETTDKVADVYERAVLAVTYSVDIWLHYCQFAISTQGEPDNIRSLFERGLAYVGSDYLSYPLWDEYINYEYTLQDWSRVAMIYTRILENPIQQLDRYFNSFKEYTSTRPLSDIFTAEDSAILAANSKISEHGVEGEVRPDVVEQSTESVSAGFSEAEQLEKYIAIREEMYKKAKEFDSKIINFETAIRRPYFHVKPLDDPELENWHNYLDFIESGDDFNKVVKLYERCLIACANYPEFWIRYVLCMEASGSMDLADNALARATQVFVKKQPEIHLFAARFKEFNGDADGARAEHHLLYSEYSSAFLEAIVRRANMEHRLENKDAAFSIFEEAIASEQAKKVSQILPMIYIQYSRFALLVACDATKAREILTGALEHIQLSRPLLEAVIHLESFLPLPKRIAYLDSLVEKFITPGYDNSNTASPTDREDISCIFLEFLDLFGDPQTIKKADNRHALLFLRQKGTVLSRKRRAEDYMGSDRTKMSKTNTADPLAGQTVMAGYPNVQNQCPASYGQNPSVWPSVSQAQAQQWNPNYAAQAGYSSYGGYSTYAHPQIPTSAPQSTAYGTYPAPPAMQGYPQSNYAQPSAAYSQQQAPATQAYYSSYY